MLVFEAISRHNKRLAMVAQWINHCDEKLFEKKRVISDEEEMSPEMLGIDKKHTRTIIKKK